MPRLAIVGAGPAGLAAAWKLRGSGIEVEVFEKSRGVFGRAASRTRHGVRMDPGANYLKAETPEIEDLILRQLPTAELAQIVGDIWIFDRRGRLQAGAAEQNKIPKWTYRTGISTLGKLLADAADAVVHQEKEIARIARTGNLWSLDDHAGGRHENFDAILLTPPAPQTVALLEASDLGDEFAPVVQALRQASFRPQFTFVFGFDGERERPENFHALLNLDGEHPLAWLSFENDKPGHVPPGLTVIVVQTQPEWSADHFASDIDELAAVACQHATELLRWENETPLWHEAQRWRYAQPAAAADSASCQSAEGAGIFVAGDALVGKGRVGRAMSTGLEAASRIRAQLLK